MVVRQKESGVGICDVLVLQGPTGESATVALAMVQLAGVVHPDSVLKGMFRPSRRSLKRWTTARRKADGRLVLFWPGFLMVCLCLLLF